jgi:hypothetical protein
MMDALKGVMLIELLDLLEQLRSFNRFFPAPSKFIRCSWCGVLVSGFDYALRWRAHRGKEVGVGLRWGTLETKTFEVGTSFVRRAKVYLATLIQDDDFVKELYKISTELMQQTLSCSHCMLLEVLGR